MVQRLVDFFVFDVGLSGVIKDGLKGRHRLPSRRLMFNRHQDGLGCNGQQRIIGVVVGKEVEEHTGRVRKCCFVGGLFLDGSFAKASQRVSLVEVKAVEEVTLMGVVTWFLIFHLQTAAQLFQSGKALFNHHFFTEQIGGHEVHRHCGLFDQPGFKIPMRVQAKHGVGELTNLCGHFLDGHPVFLPVLLFVAHGQHGRVAAYEASPAHQVVFLKPMPFTVSWSTAGPILSPSIHRNFGRVAFK